MAYIYDYGDIKYRDGEPCNEHPCCLQHQSHPCEGCGRIGGRGVIYNIETVRLHLRSVEEH
jgi:hypothetical protein